MKITLLITCLFASLYVKAQYIPNGEFENWYNNSGALNWSSCCIHHQSTDAYTGSYADSIRSAYCGHCGGIALYMSSSEVMAVVSTTDTLVGYYKYFPSHSGDTASLKLYFYNSSNSVVFRQDLPATNSYTRFEIPFDITGLSYDSSYIRISSSRSAASINTGSSLLIDHLYFSSFPVGVEEEIRNCDLTVFPNPADDHVFIKSCLNGIVMLTDLSGRQFILKETSEAGNYNLAHVPEGIYIMTITSEYTTSREKVVVLH